MRIINSNGFQEDERIQIRAVIYSNVIIAFRVLLEIMEDEHIDFSNSRTRRYAEMIETTDADVDAEDAFSDPQIKEAMLAMWEDPGIKKAVSKGHEYALNDNLTFYFSSIDKMFSPGWIPDDQDMLHARLRTTGITETLFEMGHLMVNDQSARSGYTASKVFSACYSWLHFLATTNAWWKTKPPTR